MPSRLAISAGNVVRRSRIGWGTEDLLRDAVLHEFAIEQIGGVIAQPAGLRHVVGDDDGRHATPPAANQLLHAFGAGDVERGAGFIHQDDFRLQG